MDPTTTTRMYYTYATPVVVRCHIATTRGALFRRFEAPSPGQLIERARYLIEQTNGLGLFTQHCLAQTGLACSDRCHPLSSTRSTLRLIEFHAQTAERRPQLS
jgi:hypothetical protein